jgi:sugar transferase (PEP-CTERM/EpsH1 system associated)
LILGTRISSVPRRIVNQGDMNSTVNVAHIVLSLGVGGLERVVVNLVKGIDRARFNPMVCCIEGRGPLSEEIESSGIPVFYLRKTASRDYPLVLKLASLLRRHEVVIVHTHNPSPHFYGVLAARIAQTPIIIHTKHGRNYPERLRRVFLNNVLSRLTDKVVAVSEDARNVALEVEKVVPSKVVTITNGIDVERFSQHDADHKRDEIGIPTGHFVVGNVARLAAEKDHTTLLKAFSLVLKELPNTSLLIAGDGELRGELRSISEQLGISQSVSFLGLRKDVAELLHIFHLFALSSITEGTSLTILEAMAASLPVVATDVGGNSKLVVNGKTGIVVPPRDPNALAEAIINILSNPDKAAQMGMYAHKRFTENFSLTHMLEKYENLYNHFLEKKLYL